MKNNSFRLTKENQSKLVNWGNMSTVPNEEQQSKPILGQIKVSWKDAIAEALTRRWRTHSFKAVAVSSIVGIFVMIQGDHLSLLRWVVIGAGIFIVNIGEDARLQRRASRSAWWVDPRTKTDEGK